MKKILAVSIAGIINITTLAGCSFGGKRNPEPIEQPKIEYSSIDEEIKIKEAFVTDAFEKVSDNVGKPLYDVIYRQTQTDFSDISENEEKLDPDTELGMERKYFSPEVTDKEIKEQIADSYDKVIEEIESHTQPYEDEKILPEIDYYNFAIDYQEEHKQCK